ncbi:AP-2 complex subunit mu [Raphidocelis subcapitata]|uniref:AP-2 complex subunit mu n=1 Tax=Raphidocelis subcapitata TaxID=307507 RepID=A0A2V0NWS8_9CHLO|nr:AP-2 complex subunit mu [Raphidocelis subcapitata]|eukprot:GBF91132.1 AP-2 complex subunit mu [Raphidocelis subcapitata]
MAHACAAIYFLSLRGDVLIERRYRDDVERDMAENFRTQILNNKDAASTQTPVRTLGSVTFMYLRHNDVYLLMVTRNNANVMMSFKFMTSGALDEGSVKRNFTLIYELLDEVMDFGFPQLTEPASLKSFIFQKGVRGESSGGSGVGAARDAQSATLTVTGAVSWRREGIRYKSNEVFLDIVEEVNLLMGSGGTVLRCDVVGRILMKCRLSDMPELRLGLNDKLEDVTFHQCVNLGTYEAQRVVTFIPPDGEFELMKYRSTEGVSAPFRVTPVVKELGRTRLEAAVSVRALFGPKLFGLSVVVLVPVPDNTAKAAISVTTGKAKYDATKKAIVWKIRRFAGGAEHSLRAEVSLVASTRGEAKPWGRPPISMSFQVPMFSSSGMRVAYLKILERRLGAGYQVDKWVRKVTKSGDYLIRV